MRTLITLTSLFCLASSAGWSVASEQPPPEVLRAANAASAPGRHGLVVGIERFDDPAFPPLEWAEADAAAMGSVLSQNGGFDSTTLITTDEATTREALLAVLDAFLDGLGPDDTALIYVSTHGVIDYVDGRPVRYLLTRNSQEDDLRHTALEVREVLERIDAAQPRWKVVILASCFGGDGEGLRSTPELHAQGRRGPARLQPIDAWPRRATVVLSASYLDGPAWEDPDLGHEIYTYYLLEALTSGTDEQVDLNGDGALSAFEAHGHAARRTVEHTAGRQFPSANLDAVGERDVVLVGDPDAGPARAVFWSFLGQKRGSADEAVWIDGQPVGAGTWGQRLDPGKHLLETGSANHRERARRLSFRVRKGESVDVRTLVARSEDQWLGIEFGGVFLPGAPGYNEELAEIGPTDGSDAEAYQLPGASPTLRLAFEQRLWPRRTRAPTLGITTGWWPARPHEGGLSFPARVATLDLSLLMERRGPGFSLGVGPVGGLLYLQSTGRDGAMGAVVGGGLVRGRIRLGGRLSLRISAQLVVTRTAPLALPPQFLLLPSLSVGIGLEL